MSGVTSAMVSECDVCRTKEFEKMRGVLGNMEKHAERQRSNGVFDQSHYEGYILSIEHLRIEYGLKVK